MYCLSPTVDTACSQAVLTQAFPLRDLLAQTFVESASLVCGELCSRTWTNPRLAAVDMDGNGVADVVVLDGDGRFHWYAPASSGLSGGFTRVTSQHWLSHLHVDPRMRYVFADLTSDGAALARRGIAARSTCCQSQLLTHCIPWWRRQGRCCRTQLGCGACAGGVPRPRHGH